MPDHVESLQEVAWIHSAGMPLTAMILLSKFSYQNSGVHTIFRMLGMFIHSQRRRNSTSTHELWSRRQQALSGFR